MAEQKAPGVVKSIEYDGETFEVPFAKGNPGKSREELDEIKRELRESGESSDGEMVATMGFCAPYQPRTYLTELPGVICERDQACVLRDGMIIYADIYRPAATAEKVPVICAFGPFGKNPSEGMDSWQLMGVPAKDGVAVFQVRVPRPGLLVSQRLRGGQRRSARCGQFRGRRVPVGAPGRAGRVRLHRVGLSAGMVQWQGDHAR